MNKYSKLKPLMLIPLFKLVVCFSIKDNIESAVKLFEDDISKCSAVNDANSPTDEQNKAFSKNI